MPATSPPKFPFCINDRCQRGFPQYKTYYGTGAPRPLQKTEQVCSECGRPLYRWPPRKK